MDWRHDSHFIEAETDYQGLQEDFRSPPRFVSKLVTVNTGYFSSFNLDSAKQA
jgi:hypothetical protein